MAKHASPEDHSFLISVGQHLGAAVALVALVAAAFCGIGQVKVDDSGTDGPVIANPSEDTGGTTDDSSADSSDDTSADGTTGGADSAGDAPSTTDGTDAEPASEAPSAEPEPEPTTEAPSPDPEPEPEPTATATTDGAIAPSSISVQVLDAVRDDGSAAAEDVEQRLKADGYRVVANNPASKTYEVTTVFYSEGYEAQARQIADAYGWSAVEPKPSNLSSSVQVHVVVGLDEA